MSIQDLILSITVTATTLGLLTGIIVNADKIKKYLCKTSKNLRKREVERMLPIHQDLCPVYRDYPEISNVLKELSMEVKVLQGTTTSLLGDRLLQKSTHHLNQGYMPDYVHEKMIEEYIRYHFTGGNGPVFAKVSAAVMLPPEDGAEQRNTDLEKIIRMEVERRNK